MSTAQKFEHEFKLFVNNILMLITEVGAGSVLKKLCSDNAEACGRDIDPATLLFLLREIEFYNKTFNKPSRPSATRLLNDGAVILFSMHKQIKHPEFSGSIETLLEVIKLATRLEYPK